MMLCQPQTFSPGASGNEAVALHYSQPAAGAEENLASLSGNASDSWGVPTKERVQMQRVIDTLRAENAKCSAMLARTQRQLFDLQNQNQLLLHKNSQNEALVLAGDERIIAGVISGASLLPMIENYDGWIRRRMREYHKEKRERHRQLGAPNALPKASSDYPDIGKKGTVEEYKGRSVPAGRSSHYAAAASGPEASDLRAGTVMDNILAQQKHLPYVSDSLKGVSSDYNQRYCPLPDLPRVRGSHDPADWLTDAVSSTMKIISPLQEALVCYDEGIREFMTAAIREISTEIFNYTSRLLLYDKSHREGEATARQETESARCGEAAKEKMQSNYKLEFNPRDPRHFAAYTERVEELIAKKLAQLELPQLAPALLKLSPKILKKKMAKWEKKMLHVSEMIGSGDGSNKSKNSSNNSDDDEAGNIDHNDRGSGTKIYYGRGTNSRNKRLRKKRQSSLVENYTLLEQKAYYSKLYKLAFGQKKGESDADLHDGEHRYDDRYDAHADEHDQVGDDGTTTSSSANSEDDVGPCGTPADGSLSSGLGIDAAQYGYASSILRGIVEALVIKDYELQRALIDKHKYRLLLWRMSNTSIGNPGGEKGGRSPRAASMGGLSRARAIMAEQHREWSRGILKVIERAISLGDARAQMADEVSRRVGGTLGTMLTEKSSGHATGADASDAEPAGENLCKECGCRCGGEGSRAKRAESDEASDSDFLEFENDFSKLIREMGIDASLLSGSEAKKGDYKSQVVPGNGGEQEDTARAKPLWFRRALRAALKRKYLYLRLARAEMLYHRANEALAHTQRKYLVAERHLQQCRLDEYQTAVMSSLAQRRLTQQDPVHSPAPSPECNNVTVAQAVPLVASLSSADTGSIKREGTDAKSLLPSLFHASDYDAKQQVLLLRTPAGRVALDLALSQLQTTAAQMRADPDHAPAGTEGNGYNSYASMKKKEEEIRRILLGQLGAIKDADNGSAKTGAGKGMNNDINNKTESSKKKEKVEKQESMKGDEPKNEVASASQGASSSINSLLRLEDMPWMPHVPEKSKTAGKGTRQTALSCSSPAGSQTSSSSTGTTSSSSSNVSSNKKHYRRKEKSAASSEMERLEKASSNQLSPRPGYQPGVGTQLEALTAFSGYLSDIDYTLCCGDAASMPNSNGAFRSVLRAALLKSSVSNALGGGSDRLDEGGCSMLAMEADALLRSNTMARAESDPIHRVIPGNYFDELIEYHSTVKPNVGQRQLINSGTILQADEKSDALFQQQLRCLREAMSNVRSEEAQGYRAASAPSKTGASSRHGGVCPGIAQMEAHRASAKALLSPLYAVAPPIRSPLRSVVPRNEVSSLASAPLGVIEARSERAAQIAAFIHSRRQVALNAAGAPNPPKRALSVTATQRNLANGVRDYILANRL